MKNYFFAILFGCTSHLFAQHPVEIKGSMQQETLSVNTDSLALGLLKLLPSNIDSTDATSHIDYRFLPDRSYFESNPYFGDLIFTGLNIKFNPKAAPATLGGRKADLFERKPIMSYFSGEYKAMNFIDSLREQARNKIIASSLMKVKNHVWNLPNPNQFFVRQIASPGAKDMYLNRHFEINKPQKMRINGIEKDPWSTKGNVAMQLSQNYTSSNWYQGGKSNLATLFALEASANYNDQKKIQWDNTLTIKTGIQSESADTVRHYSVTENQIRLSSKFGIKAFENWYYSVSGEFTTYSLTAYSALNSKTKVNGFLSPFRVDLGLGMDYKYKQQLSVLVTPLSFKYVYFADTLNYNKKNFGVQPGERKLHEFGSLIKVEYKQKLSPTVDLSSRFSFYTNYKKVEVDWEATTTFVLTRYLSFMATLHPRYDTAVIAAGDKKAKIQMKEMMSFGFAYKFDNIRAKNRPLQ